ncbi:alpha-L-rhamnosidase C-terminal domain-containing protein [Sinomonas sp. P10A9]|uniref:alpha-L-rhamnosidase n=1 Tax=Sinomonas puerhi TaxID=3238584 RepID=A0AB39L1Y8_9MICC
MATTGTETSNDSQATAREALGPLVPVRLRVEGAERCLTAGPTPRLSWQAEARAGAGDPSSAGTRTGAEVPDGRLTPVAAEARILAVDGRVLWAPGPLALPAHATTRVVVPAASALPPDTECSWTVRLRSADGAWGPWSAEHAFGTGLGDADWTAQWITRAPGGRAPIRIVHGLGGRPELRWHGIPFVPAPAEAEFDFTLEAELRPVLGACGIVFHSGGPGTGLLLELGPGDRITLRPLAAWGQPCGPEDWASAPLAEAALPAPSPASTDRHPDGRVRPGETPWRHLRAEARGGRLAVAVDGTPVLDTALPAPAGTLLGLHATPRAEGALRGLTLSNGTEPFRYSTAADGLAGWPADTPFRQPDEWSLLRTEVRLAGPVRRAVLYAAARHQAWASVGGREVLALSSFGYPGEDYYDAADVTSAVRAAEAESGRMALGVLTHWYGPGQGRASGHPGLLAQLHLEYADGRREVFGTGPGWRAAEAPYAQAGYRNDEGDPIEHALAPLPAGWDSPGFAEGPGWGPGVVLGTHPREEFPALHPRRAHTAEEQVDPVRWLTAADGTRVADFGAVRALRPHAPFDGASGPGETVRLRAGYSLRADGRVDEAKTPSQNTDMSFLAGPGFADTNTDTDTGAADGAAPGAPFEARVHLGFRYLEIEARGAQGGVPAGVSAAVVRAAHPEAPAAVETSDSRLNRVLALLQDSALHGVQERFTDTPTREKGQFLADAVNISLATMAAFGEREFTRQALREFVWSGTRYWNAPQERGRLNAVYPNGDGKRDIPDFSLMLPEWAEAYWLNSGDDTFAAELLPALEATCGYVRRAIPDAGPCTGLVTDLPGGGGPYLHGIVDWPGPNRHGYDMAAAARTAVNAQAYAALTSTSRLAGVLGREALAASLRDSAAALAAAMEAKLRVDGVLVDGLHADGVPSRHGSQHASASPLAVGATLADHRSADAWRAASLGLQMGPMTWHRLLAALVREGLVEEALALVLDDSSRGPLAWLDAGATFAWESWEIVEGTDYSQSHAWAAAAWPVLVDGILGLRRVAPGRFEVRPPACRLERARAELPVEQGRLGISWRRSDAGVELECELPPGTEALVTVPDTTHDAAPRLLGPGRHTLGPARWGIR